ncbi:MAG: DUF1707 and DUF2154 domain-containing protein [Nocardiopsaceae bacterium]|nr:DUF1707 and DUF2154 domain-containing protein [Nocardiopsaceae bacterium]
MNSPAVPERGQLRASDADRERVAEIVRQAAGDGRLTLEELDQRLDQVYAAKTYADLEPITRDLPQPGTAHVPAPAAPADPARFGGEPGTPAAIAIMGGFCRKGDWVVPRQFTAFTLMGGGEIDMRYARFAEQTVTIHAVTIMGGIEITVPDDANVRVTGIGIMGGFDHSASGPGAPGGPTIVIDGAALMGGVEVKRKRPKQTKLDKLGRGSPELE